MMTIDYYYGSMTGHSVLRLRLLKVAGGIFKARAAVRGECEKEGTLSL